MRRAAKRDDNEGEIVAALRKAGAVVRFITQGDGLPDLLVGFQGRTILMEVKDGAKVPSQRRLTDDDQKFFDSWTGGELYKVESVEEALAVLSQRL